MKEQLQQLAASLEGEFYSDDTMRTLYATDASAYREMPLAVTVPKTKEDIKKLQEFVNKDSARYIFFIPDTLTTSSSK